MKKIKKKKKVLFHPNEKEVEERNNKRQVGETFL